MYVILTQKFLFCHILKIYPLIDKIYSRLTIKSSIKELINNIRAKIFDFLKFKQHEINYPHHSDPDVIQRPNLFFRHPSFK